MQSNPNPTVENCRAALFGHRPVLLLLLALACGGAGCIGRANPAATQPATAQDPKTAHAAYWLDQPAVASVGSKDFDALWNACRNVARDDGFIIDRTDYREGILTTLPRISKMPYEVWRNDVVTAHDLAQSTLDSIRRTVRFDIRKLPDGSFQAVPNVLVERDSLIEKRITSVSQYQEVFAIRTQDVDRQTEQSGGEAQPAEYWYAIGRDPALERQLAEGVNDRLKSAGKSL